MGLNLAYDINGVATLVNKPLEEGLYTIRLDGRMQKAWITVVVSKRFKIKSRRAFITLEDGTTLDVVKHGIAIEVPGELHRIPGEGAWHGGSGGGTEC